MPSAPPRLAIIDTSQADAAAELARLRQKLSPDGEVVSEAGRRRTVEVFGEPLTPSQVVARICGDVRSRGLEAVLEYSARIDRAELSAAALKVEADELARSHAAADPALLATVRRIRESILRFQTALLHREVRVPLPHGGYLAQRYLPLTRVGICVPGGAAAYPSTVLMTAVPAQAAGVRELAIVAPPTPCGAYNADLLATCYELGIREVYRLGGAQAVAALAYGVNGIARVDKIVGPGNLFVALAKKYVFGDVDIDSIAGPSEVLIIADDATPAEYVAADMLAQAEHAPGSAILVTTSREVCQATAAALVRQLSRLERSDLARQSLEEFGALVLARDDEEMIRLANEFAPEHLHVACRDPERWLDRITSAGAVFLGPHSPVAAGDYAAGPSHVLPTGGTARFAHGLSANDFLRSHSVIACTREDLEALSADIATLAQCEGLTAHAASIAVRRGG